MSGTRDRDLVMEAPPSPGVATVSAISPFWRHNTATGHKGGHRRSVHSDEAVRTLTNNAQIKLVQIKRNCELYWSGRNVCIIPCCQRNVQP